MDCSVIPKAPYNGNWLSENIRDLMPLAFWSIFVSFGKMFVSTQLTFTCSKSTIETVEKGAKYV